MVGGRLEVADGPCGVSNWKYALSMAALGERVFRHSKKANCSFSVGASILNLLAGVGSRGTRLSLPLFGCVKFMSTIFAG